MHFLQLGLRLLESGGIFNEGVTPKEREEKGNGEPQASKDPLEKCLLNRLAFIPVPGGMNETQAVNSTELNRATVCFLTFVC